MDQIKEHVANNIDQIADKLCSLNDRLAENPEIGFEEYRAVRWITEILEENNFTVETGLGGLETAFRGVYNFKNQSGPRIAFLCEYDALPDIGHGCGHNIIATSGLGAGLGVSKLNNDELAGAIEVIGCPGEENGGGKVTLVEEGIFEEVDIAMLVHPSTVNRVCSTSLALDALEFTFHGQSAHAASAPEKGINALDGVIQLFNGINALREHLKDDVRMHGIITEGGQAPNVVPEKAVARFYVRAEERSYLNEVVKKVKNIARGAAEMVGGEVEWKYYELSNDNLVTNNQLADLFKMNYKLLGITDIDREEKGMGSTDMGNVSQVVPAIHPYIKIGSESKINSHTIEFAQVTTGRKGHEGIINAAKAMAFTALDVILNKENLKKIKKEFRQVSKNILTNNL